MSGQRSIVPAPAGCYCHSGLTCKVCMEEAYRRGNVGGIPRYEPPKEQQ